MRSIVVLLVVASPALGQLSVENVTRRVEARAVAGCDMPGNSFTLDEWPIVTEGDPLEVTADVDGMFGVTNLGARVTAWQDLTEGARGISVRGGVRGAARYGVNPACSAFILGRSTMEVIFDLDREAFMSLSVDAIEPPSQTGGPMNDRRIHSGDVIYELTGPNLNTRVDPPRVTLTTPDMVPVEAVMRSNVEERLLGPGQYTLFVSAALTDNPFVRSDLISFRDVEWDVHLNVVHTPEPSTWVLAALVILSTAWRWVRIKGFQR